MARKKEKKKSVYRRSLGTTIQLPMKKSLSRQPSSGLSSRTCSAVPSSTTQDNDMISSEKRRSENNHHHQGDDETCQERGRDNVSMRTTNDEINTADDDLMEEDHESEHLQHASDKSKERTSLVANSSSSGRSRRLEKTERSGRNDPVGISGTTTGTILYEDKTLKTLNSSTYPIKEDSFSSHNNGIMHEEPEDCVLLDDTFTFLMTGTYPLEDCFFSKQIQEHFMDEEGEENSVDEEELGKLNHENVSEENVPTDGKDPDKYYLPFWLGLFVIVSQIFIYTLVIAKVFDNKLPPNADVWLRLSQGFAVIVTLYTQSDFIDGMWLFTERWKAFKDITGPIKFNISVFIRVIAGNFGIAATFILVMYSEEVVDLLLNFTAMEFVATLDGSAFELASKGFLGNTLERKAKEVRAVRYRPRHSMKLRTRCVMYFVYIILVFAGFFVICGLQARRSVGVDNEVYIQFDDTGIPELYGISGVYKGCTFFRTDETSDIGYVDINIDCHLKRQKKNKSRKLPAGSFVYCKKEREGWVYLPEETSKPCDEFLLRSFLNEDSIPSNAFDILTHSRANWIVRRPGIGHEAILTNFVVESVKNIQSDLASCDGAGLLRTDKSTSRQRPFQPLEGKFYPKYKLKRSGFGSELGEMDYSDFGQIFRPMFIRKVYNDNRNFQVILYDGLRWNRLYLNPLLFASHIKKEGEEECKLDDDDDDRNCWSIFLKNFRTEKSWRSNSTIVFFDAISDPLMILSTADTGVPTKDLRWYEPRLVNVTVLPGQPKRGFDPQTDVAGYVDPTVQELCVDDYTYDYYQDVYDHYQETEDAEVPTLSIFFFQFLQNLCGEGEDAGVGKACDGLSDYVELGEDYDYFYDYLSKELECNNDIQAAPFGFSCDLSSQFECSAGETILQINFATDFIPEDYRVIVFLGDAGTSIADLDVANRIFVSEQATEFSIPEAGLAELRFTKPNTEYLLSTCVPNEVKNLDATCVQVIILDTGFDGVFTPYALSYGSEIPIVGGGPGNDFSCRKHYLGPGCISTTPKDIEKEPTASPTASALPSECSLYTIDEDFPEDVSGDIGIPKLPTKMDVIDETFAVTADGWVTLAPGECEEDDDIGLKIDVLTDACHEETLVGVFFGNDLNDTLGNTNIISPTTTSEKFEMSEGTVAVLEFPFLENFLLGTCFPKEIPCVQVVIVDTYGDGLLDNATYAITYGSDTPVGSDDENTIAFECRKYQFGSGCSTALDSASVECNQTAALDLFGFCNYDYPCPDGQFCGSGFCEFCDNVEECANIESYDIDDCRLKCEDACNEDYPCLEGQFCTYDARYVGSCEFCDNVEECANIESYDIDDCRLKCEDACNEDYPCLEGQFCTYDAWNVGSCEFCDNVEECTNIESSKGIADCELKCGMGSQQCSNDLPCPEGQFCGFYYGSVGSCVFCADVEDCANNVTLPPDGVTDCQAKCD